MSLLFNESHRGSAELSALARVFKRFGARRRGRRAVDVPAELTREEAAKIDRSRLSTSQRQKTPKVKPMGRPRRYSDQEIQRVVSEVREAKSEGLTLTYSDIQTGSAFVSAAKRVYGNDLAAEKVHYIWRNYKDRFA